MLLLSVSSYAQNTLSLKEQIDKDIVTDHLRYFVDSNREFNIETIKSCEFLPFKNKSFPGLFRKKFWFKLDINSSQLKTKDYLFRIKAYAFINNLKIYAVTANKTTQIFEHTDFVNRKINIPFSNVANTTYYFETDFYMSAYLNMSIQSKEYYNSIRLKEQSFTGLYYGFSFLILVLNLLFYSITRNRYFLYYVFFQFCITASICYLDNYIYTWFGFTFITKAFNVFLNISLSIFGSLFVYVALNLKKHFPYFKYISLYIIVISTFFYILYLATWDYKWSSYGKFGYLSILILLLLTALFFSFKQVYARFFVLGYGLLLTCHILYLLPVAYGLKDFGFNEWHYKIGSTIEMFVFLIAIPFRHKVLIKEKEIITDDILQNEKFFFETLKNLKPISDKEKTKKFSLNHDLTVRQSQTFSLIIAGKTNKEISVELFIGIDSVKQHCSSLYRKLGVKNRAQLIALFNKET